MSVIFDKDHLADALQPPHLVDEDLHDDDRHHGKQRAVRRDVVQLEDDEALREQVQLPVGVEQVVVLAAPVVGLQHVEQVRQVEILLADVLLLQQPPVVRDEKLVEGVERGPD